LESPICLCAVRLINPIIINLLCIAAGNVSVVWERFQLQDCVIEHRFVSGEKHREHKVDGQRQGEPYSKRYSSIPRRYAISNRRVLTPTCIFVFKFMLLMSPGIVGGTETIIAAAARQLTPNQSICIPVPSMRLIHCRNVDMCAMYEPIVGYHDSGDRAEEDGVTTHES